MQVQTETSPVYQTSDEDAIIAQALKILAGRLLHSGKAVESSRAAKDYIRLKIGGLPYETFGVLFMDTRHVPIAFEEMFRGTLDSCSVHPREIARRALELNAGAIILSHNHPSGNPSPSQADERITRVINDAMKLFDIRVLDHIIVSPADTYSFSDNGMMGR